MAEPPLLASLVGTIAVAPVASARPERAPEIAARPADTFTNPVCESGADPWVVRWRGAYYYCHSRAGSVCVSRAERLHEVGRRPAAVVWAPAPGRPYSRHLWAPELHHLDGRFYIYVAADDGRNRTHRMYVLRGHAEDPQRPFELLGRIADPADRWAIDGTVLTLAEGRRYFVWSGWEGEANVAQSLYIAPMSEPWTIDGCRVRISSPEHPWEANDRPHVNEGPSVLRSRDGEVFLVYSAGGSWTDEYCLGLLRLVGADPMQPSSWVKARHPVFARSGQVFGPGHACFVRSPDGSQDWIVYHAARHKGAGWKRDVRMQRFGWNSDGSPSFGTPVPPGTAIPVPSGSC